MSGFGSYFRVIFMFGLGNGSYKYTSLDPIFSFEKNPTLSASLSSLPPSATSLSSPSLCKSNILLCVQTVNRAEILCGFLNSLLESVQLVYHLCVFALWLVSEKTVEEKTNLKFGFSYFSHFSGVASGVIFHGLNSKFKLFWFVPHIFLATRLFGGYSLLVSC